MTNWRDLYERRDWDALENWWPHCEDTEEVRAFFEALRRDVPTRELRNGMERVSVPVTTKEAPPEWKRAAKILELGELEARIIGPPKRPSVQLQNVVTRLKSLLVELQEKPDPTEGAHEFSRAGHIDNVFDQFEELEKITWIAVLSVDPDGVNPNDQAWVRDVIAEAFLAGLEAGAHSVAAIGKGSERMAVSAEKALIGARRGSEARKAPFIDRDRAIVDRMSASMSRGHSKAAAAKHASDEGLGTSAAANIKVYDKHVTSKK